ncbi:MAG: hypothetical protein AB7E70_21595 [Hyphomicrobiaceae bacterium]
MHAGKKLARARKRLDEWHRHRLDSAAMQNINVRDVGPIRSVSIPVPPEGGIVVLRGPNGAGKSVALDAVDGLTRQSPRKPKAGVRRGALDGAVEGLGRSVRLSMTRSQTGGELEVEAISDDVSVDQLVDPGLKDPAAADRRRIRAALVLAGITPDIDEFGKLVGGTERLREFVSKSALATDDPVEMADKIRLELHAAARRFETEATSKEAQAAGLRSSASGEPDIDEAEERRIRQTHEQRIWRRDEMRRAIAEAQRTRIARAAAEQAVEAGRNRLTVQDAEATLAQAEAELASVGGEIAQLRERLAEATAREAALKDQRRVASMRVQEATQAEAAFRAASDALAKLTEVEEPTAEEMAEAEAEVAEATAMVERLGIAREAMRKRSEAGLLASQAGEALSTADRLREAARSVDDVLGAMMRANGPANLTISDGRLYIERDGEKVPFAELSDGEKWRIALDIAIDALGEHRVLAISQVAWEGLDAEARDAIMRHAMSRKTVIVTAEADHSSIGELRAETYAG